MRSMEWKCQIFGMRHLRNACYGIELSKLMQHNNKMSRCCPSIGRIKTSSTVARKTQISSVIQKKPIAICDLKKFRIITYYWQIYCQFLAVSTVNIGNQHWLRTQITDTNLKHIIYGHKFITQKDCFHVIFFWLIEEIASVRPGPWPTPCQRH